MKILHVDEQRTWRGGEQQASWFMQGLAQRGHTVAIAARPDSEFIVRDHGVDCERIALPLRSEADALSAWRLAKAARARDIDVLHAHSSHAHMLACVARRFAPTLKVVVSRRVSFAPKANPITRWKYRQPDKLVAVSGEVARVLRDYGVPDDRLALVYSSVDFARLEVAPIARRELSVPKNAPLLVTAGALVGHKDHANFLKAFKVVRESFPNACGLIAGDGELRSDLERLRAELDLNDAVTFLGHRADVPAIIRAADVYVSSSWSEGLGTSVLEALGCETPVVAAVAGGIPEMVVDGETGRLVPNRDAEALANAILETLNNPDAAQRLAANSGRLVREKFSVDRMVEGTLRVYEDVLRNGRTA